MHLGANTACFSRGPIERCTSEVELKRALVAMCTMPGAAEARQSAHAFGGSESCSAACPCLVSRSERQLNGIHAPWSSRRAGAPF